MTVDVQGWEGRSNGMTVRSRLDRELATIERRTARNVANIRGVAVARLAHVQGEEIVQTAKLKAIDSLSREAFVGHAMLHHFARSVAAGDPFLADDLRFFTDVARLGKGEIIADTVDTFCRESRR